MMAESVISKLSTAPKSLLKHRGLQDGFGDVMVEHLMKDMLVRNRCSIQELIQDATLLEAARQHVETKYPGTFAQNLLEDSEVLDAIERQAIEDTIRARGMSLETLIDDAEYLDDIVAYYAAKHPTVNIHTSMAYELLEGKWSAEVENLLEEIVETELEESCCRQMKVLKNSGES